MKQAIILMLAALLMVATVSAYASPYPNNYVNHAGSEPRMGAYYGNTNFAQQWYGYLDAPRYQQYTGSPWTITNIRVGQEGVIPPVTHQPNIYRSGGYYPGPWDAGWNRWSGSTGGYGYGTHYGYNYGGFNY